VGRHQKGKTNLDFTEARDSEWQWQWHQLGHMQVCTSLQTDNHISTSPLKFFTGRMSFLPPNQQHQSTEGNSWYWHKKVALMHYTPSLRSLGWMKNKRVIWPPGTQQRPFYSHYTGQPALASTWMSLLVQSFTARMSSLTTTCTCGLGRRS